MLSSVNSYSKTASSSKRHPGCEEQTISSTSLNCWPLASADLRASSLRFAARTEPQMPAPSQIVCANGCSRPTSHKRYTLGMLSTSTDEPLRPELSVSITRENEARKESTEVIDAASEAHT